MGRILLGVAALIVAAAIATVYLFTGTDWGRERLRTKAVAALSGGVHGIVRIGSLSGNLLTGATLAGVSITDSAGAPFLAADSVVARYSLRTLFSKRIFLQDVRLVNPVVVVDQPPGGKWNYERLFPTDSAQAPGPPGWSSWARLTDVTIINGHLTLRSPWSPSAKLSAEQQDSVIRLNLGPKGRQNIMRVPGGFQRISDFQDIYGTFPVVRWSDPRFREKLFQVSRLRMTAQPLRPPAVLVTSMQGVFYVNGDSAWWSRARVGLAGSRIVGDGRYTIANNNLRLRLRGDTVATADLRWIDPAIPENGTGSLNFALDWVGDTSTYAARNASVTVGDTKLAGSLGVTTLGDTIAYHNTDVTFARLDTRLINQLFPSIVPPRQGLLSGRAAVEGTLRRLSVDGDVAFDDRGGAGRSRVVAKGTLGVNKGVFDATDLRLAFLPVQVALARTFAPGFPLGGTLTGSAVLDGSSATRLSFRGDVTHVQGGARSRVAGTGSFARGRVPLVNLNVQASPLSLVTVGRFVPAAGLRGSVAGPIRISGPMRDLAIDVDLTTPDGGNLTVRGSADLAGATKAYDLATTMRLFDASSVSSRAPRTSLTADATVRGQGFDPATMNTVLAANIQASRYDTMGVDSATVRVSAANGLLTVDTLVVDVPDATANIAGTLGLTSARTGTLRYNVSIDSLSSLAGLLAPDTGVVAPRPGILSHRMARARADSTRIAEATEVERAATGKAMPRMVVDTPSAVSRAQLSGSVKASGAVTGNIRNLMVSGSATGNSIVALGNTIQSATAAYRWQNALSPASQVQVIGTATSVMAYGFALDSVTVNTSYAKPNGTVKLDIRQADRQVYSVNADYLLNKVSNVIRLSDLQLRFDTTVYASTGPSTIRYGTAGFDISNFELRSRENGRIYIDGRVPGGGEADLRLDVTRFDVANALDLLQSDIPASGLVNLSVRARGTTANPTFEGAFGTQGFVYSGTALPELHGTLRYANQTLTGRAEANQPGGPAILVAQGTVPVNLALSGVTGPRIPTNRNIDLTVNADSFPLTRVPQLTALVSNLRGAARAAFTVRGTLSRPLLAGNVTITDGSARLVPLGITLNAINTSIRMLRDTVIIDSLVASSGGPVRLSGGVGIGSLSAPSFALKLFARNARVLDNDNGQLRADVDVALNGPFTGAAFTGTARIREGTLYIPEPSNKTLIGAGDPALFSVIDTAVASERSIFPAQSPLLANLSGNIFVSVARDVFVRSQQANVEVYTDGDLRIGVNRAKRSLVLDGVLLSDRGEYRFQGRRFQIRRGSATFVNTPELNPTLQVSGDYEVRLPTREAITIQIVIAGTLNTPKISVASDAQPPISQTDLLSYLAFGRASSSLLQQEGSALSSGGAGSGNLVGVGAALAAKQVAAAALGAISDQVAGDAARALGADVFDIAPADVQLGVGGFLRGTQIEFGKYIQQRTFLQLQVRPDPASLQRPGFQLQHRFPGNAGYRFELSLEPRYLFREPSLARIQTPVTTSVLGLFVVREWRY